MDEPMFPHTISVYNRYSVSLPPFPPSTAFSRTIIRGVSWKEKTHTNANSNGRSTIDTTVSITIPLEAVVEGGRAYIRSNEYERLPADNDNFWTLKAGETDMDTIALGETPELTSLFTITDLRNQYQTMDIRSVSDTTDQDILPMWKIDGV